MNYKVRKSMDPLFEWNVPMLYPDINLKALAQEPADLRVLIVYLVFL